MNKITFTIPEGHRPLNIRETLEDDVRYIEVDLIEKDKMCNIRGKLHIGYDCPCNKKEDDRTKSL